jgi:ABC-type bacteriocin/lantibiotic exporter with double-glycine peptidase domain
MERKSGGRRAVRPAALVFCLAACLLLAACASRGLPPGFEAPQRRNAIPDVPFHAQEAYQCGPASLAGVLNHWGDPVTPQEIARDIYRDDIHGTVSLDLVLYARQRGFDARWYDGSVQALQQAVDAGEPLLLMLDYGISLVSTYHYLVVVGYSPQGVLVNSGLEEHKHIAWEDFLGPWSRTEHWTLHITPKQENASG